MAMAMPLACGDDSNGEASGASMTGQDSGSAGSDATTGATAAGESEASSADATTAGDTGTTAGSGDASGTAGSSGDTGEPASCDSLRCGPDDVCVEDRLPPMCTILEDPGRMCDPGQTMTFCGGAGIPCCCDPPPPFEYRCASAIGCADGPRACACLGTICAEGYACSDPASAADPFVCEPLPKP